MRAYQKRRLFVVAVLLLSALSGFIYEANQPKLDYRDSTVQSSQTVAASGSAQQALQTLEVKGRAPKTGYSRDQFSTGWADAGGCDVRNFILKRDMTAVITRSMADCTVMQGTLNDPYTGKTIRFVRGSDNSSVQIDHMVALSNAWQTGAQQLTSDQRFLIANDQLNLMAVDGPTNQKKGDGDAATWLPPNKNYRCQYVARQIAVKQKYHLWVTQAESEAMQKVLHACPGQALPSVSQ